MRVVYKTKDERMEIEFKVEGIENVVTALAQIQDILENTRCQACVGAGRADSYGTRLGRRVSGSYTFYEAKCGHPDCGAALALSQRKPESGGGLYTKRRQGKNDPIPGEPIENNGWTWFRKDESAPAQTSSSPSTQPQPAHPDVPDDDIPFSVAVAFLSAGLLGGLILASQDVLQMWY